MREDYYAKEWKGWVNMNLPPSSRAHLAFAMNQKDKSAAAGQADLKTYTKETPENVRTVEALFGQALAGKKDLPSKTSLGELKVGNKVIADVMLYRGRTVHSPKRCGRPSPRNLEKMGGHRSGDAHCRLPEAGVGHRR